MVSAIPANIVGRVLIRASDGMFVIWADWDEQPQFVSTLTETWQTVEHEIALRFMRLQSQNLWLHAGAVAWQNEGVLFLGEWGQGKSSLVTELYHQNWHYCSDDLVPWAAAENRILPFPQTPRVRKVNKTALTRPQVSQLARQTVPLSHAASCIKPVPVRLIVDLVFVPQSRMRLTPLSPSQGVLALMQALINQDTHRETAVSHFVHLLTHTPAYQLTYNDRKKAAELVAQQFRQQDTQAR